MIDNEIKDLERQCCTIAETEPVGDCLSRNCKYYPSSVKCLQTDCERILLPEGHDLTDKLKAWLKEGNIPRLRTFVDVLPLNQYTEVAEIVALIMFMPPENFVRYFVAAFGGE